MYQFRSLIANLEKELKKLDIDESIELRISIYLILTFK